MSIIGDPHLKFMFGFHNLNIIFLSMWGLTVTICSHLLNKKLICQRVGWLKQTISINVFKGC